MSDNDSSRLDNVAGPGGDDDGAASRGPSKNKMDDGDEEAKKIFVGGLSWETNQDDLSAYFSKFGNIVDCNLLLDRETGKSRGFGFITFDSVESVKNVLAQTPHKLKGKVIQPKACNSKSEESNTRPMKRPRTNKEHLQIFVGGLPNSNEQALKEAFTRFGKVTDALIMIHHETKKPRGFGFITFEEEESVNKAVAEHYVDVNGKKVEVKRVAQTSGGGGGGGNKYKDGHDHRREQDSDDRNGGGQSRYNSDDRQQQHPPPPGYAPQYGSSTYAMTPWGVFPAAPVVPAGSGGPPPAVGTTVVTAYPPAGSSVPVAVAPPVYGQVNQWGVPVQAAPVATATTYGQPQSVSVSLGGVPGAPAAPDATGKTKPTTYRLTTTQVYGPPPQANPSTNVVYGPPPQAIPNAGYQYGPPPQANPNQGYYGPPPQANTVYQYGPPPQANPNQGYYGPPPQANTVYQYGPPPQANPDQGMLYGPPPGYGNGYRQAAPRPSSYGSYYHQNSSYGRGGDGEDDLYDDLDSYGGRGYPPSNKRSASPVNGSSKKSSRDEDAPSKRNGSSNRPSDGFENGSKPRAEPSNGVGGYHSYGRRQ